MSPPPCISDQNTSTSSSSCQTKCVVYSSLFYLTYAFFKIQIVLPIAVTVLCIAAKKMRRNHLLSNCDVYCCNLEAMEIIGSTAAMLAICGKFLENETIFHFVLFFSSFPSFGQFCFAVTTCVDRYIAVVHPVTFISLRQQRWITRRNIYISWIWMLSSAGILKMLFSDKTAYLDVLFIVLLGIVFTLTMFCSFAVILVLKRPRPGKDSGNRASPDSSKQKAFCTILIITVAMFLRFFGLIIYELFHIGYELSEKMHCILLASAFWLSLPSSLVLPLIFLHKEKELLGCKVKFFNI